jgi:hypothetical protein
MRPDSVLDTEHVEVKPVSVSNIEHCQFFQTLSGFMVHLIIFECDCPDIILNCLL